MSKESIKCRASVVWRMGAFPLLFYFAVFCVLTHPLMQRFSTHFFADTNDGLQNVWNIWWINKAVTQLHQLPWHTAYLHYPYGTSLLGHSLNPFNGIVGIFLLRFLTLVQAHNCIVVFSFVVGGLTTFLLAHYITRSYWSSIIAGFIFTFSNYHFAHAEGHLQLVSLEWIPLFALFWYMLITRPGTAVATASAVTLFAIALCDYYYLLYSILFGSLVVIWQAVRKKDPFFLLEKKYISPLAVFACVTLLTTGPLVISLLLLNIRDPLVGAHDPREFSLDLLAPLIPGGHWRFARLTRVYWSNLTSNIHESSVYMGISVLFMLIYVWLNRRKLRIRSLRLWYFVFIFFLVMSLGPALHVWGKEISFIALPYAAFEKIFPPLRLSGIPVRMMVMVMLGASVICATGFKMLFHAPTGKRSLAAILLIVLFFEYLPGPMPSSRPPVPEYVQALKALPDTRGVIDEVNTGGLALYYQTIHEKPMAFGYLARIPASVYEEDRELMRSMRDNEYEKLYRDYNFGYWAARHDGRVMLLDLARLTRGQMRKNP